MFNWKWLANLGKPKMEKYPTWADIPPIDHGLPETKETPPMPEVTPPAPPAVDYGVCHYTVGTTSTGYVELKVQDEYGYGSTLKMNPVAVKQLIRMLEVAMDEDVEQQ